MAGTMSGAYVHGYHPRENERLQDQAGTLVDLLHFDTAYPDGSQVLEAGCGVGAQTVTLARRSPHAHFMSIDISAESLRRGQAQDRGRPGITNVELPAGRHLRPAVSRPSRSTIVFVCFVLEHLAARSRRSRFSGELLRPGGTITVIEGDHGSTSSIPTAPRPTRRSSAW